MGESFFETLGLKAVRVVKTLSTCKVPLVHCSTGFMMAPWKSLKKCQCSNVLMWVAQMVMTGTPYLIEVIAPVCIQGPPLCPLPLCPLMLLKLLATSYLFPPLPMVELQHSHHQQILLLKHRLHGYLHHFTLTMHLCAPKLN